jgi:hypothetical protein
MFTNATYDALQLFQANLKTQGLARRLTSLNPLGSKANPTVPTP